MSKPFATPLFSEPVIIEFDIDEDTSFLVQVRNGTQGDWQTVHDRNTMADILNAYNDSGKSKDNKRIVVRRTQFQPVRNYSPKDEHRRQQAQEKLTEEEREALGF